MSDDLNTQVPALTQNQIVRMQSLLAKDDVATLDAEFDQTRSGPVLTQWVLDNALDVMGQSTAVLKAWENRDKTFNRTRSVYGQLAMALEPLSEEDKTALLRGQVLSVPPHPAHRYLRNYLKTMLTHWSVVSPVWVGEPSSPLRQAAVDLGWKPALLVNMLKTCMENNSNWQTWMDRVPYLYSAIAAYWVTHTQFMESWRTRIPDRVSDEPGEVLTMVAGANPLDAALARHIVACSPIALKNKLIAHPDVANVSPDVDSRLREIVQIHLHMDIFDELEQGLRIGYIPGLVEIPNIPLPTLDAG